jgi:hypothetical protein
MKVTAKKEFDPVKLEILLESQDEVDALYALGNFAVTVRQALSNSESNSGRCREQPIEKVCQAFYTPLQSHISQR